MADSTKFVQTQRLTLSGSGCTSTATSIVLASLKLPDGATNLAMTDFGDKGFITLEPGTSREEQISFTGVTQNANGTATLTGVTRGLRFVAPYDEVSANKFSHGGGAVAVVSNTAGFYNELSSKDNDETITGTWTFTTLPVSTEVPIGTTDIANKAYVDNKAFGGTITFDEEVVAGTAGETVAAGNLVYFDLTDNEWKLCDADVAATVEGVKLGIAQGSGTDGNAISGGVLVSGVDKNQTGMTQGDLMYASNTGGGIASSAGTTSKVIGIARSATDLYFDPNFYYITNASETVKGLSEEATDAQVDAGDAAGETGAKLFVTPEKLATHLSTRLKFGGTGADGALAITTGTTAIDLASAQYKELNYSSVSITGDGKLAFSNPHANGTTIVIKCKGDMTLTSSAAPMIDATNCGSAGGSGGSRVAAGTSNGSDGTDGYSYGFSTTLKGVKSVFNGIGAGGAVGTFGFLGGINDIKLISSKYPKIAVGAGGGGGAVNFDSGSGSLTGGSGGRGGGCLIIECAGTLNFTTTGGVSASGSVGANGVRVTCLGAAGGGGGGAGGVCILTYNVAGTVTGTLLASGGVGGNIGNSGAGYTAYGAGGGGSFLSAGSSGTSGDSNGAKVGGNGADGLAILSLNTEFV